MFPRPRSWQESQTPCPKLETIGRLSQLCERWIYTSCLCFALDLEEQQRSGFHYTYSVYQVEYSRNLIFHLGGQMEQVFQGLIDRTRARLNVKRLKTLFGMKTRPYRKRKGKAPRCEVVVETPSYDLTIFKLHFGKLTLKMYTKGERVLRIEVIVHNTQALRCGRRLERFPQIVVRLHQILEQFLGNVYCMDAAFISDETLNQLPTPLGSARRGWVASISISREPASCSVRSSPWPVRPMDLPPANWRETVQSMPGATHLPMTRVGPLTTSRSSAAKTW